MVIQHQAQGGYDRTVEVGQRLAHAHQDHVAETQRSDRRHPGKHPAPAVRQPQLPNDFGRGEIARLKPCFPVEQKEQSRAQPACVEMHKACP
jgi:hypothetical protein